MEPEQSVGVKARTVLWYLTFFGFAINYMIRINVNIAIVDMISAEFKGKNVVMSECVEFVNASSQTFYNVSEGHDAIIREKTYISAEKRLLDFIGIKFEKEGFKWNSKTQNEVLSAFFLLHWTTQLPGGMLAARYGTKLVFGLSNFIACITCMLVPLTAYLNFYALITLRLLQGIVAGAAWPAMNHLVGRWIPPNERSKFVTAYMGSSIGVAVTYPIFGYIIQTTSWENVFHFCGVVGTIWYALWLYFVYDLPEDHPRIHPKEKEYILNSLGSSVMRGDDKSKLAVPWKAMLTSRATWLNIIAQWGGVWGLFTLITQAPSYFRLVHGWGIEMTGILSGLPHLLRVIFSLLVSTLCDYLLSNDKMSRTNVRKFASFLSLILNGVFVLGLAFSGCHVIYAVAFLTLSLMLHGAVSSGALASLVDISPNFAGVSLGINSSFSVLTGFISPRIVGYLTNGRQNSIEPWQHVFEICAAMQLICGVLYLLFSDSSLQKWNKPQNSPQYALTSGEANAKAENALESGCKTNPEEKRLK